MIVLCELRLGSEKSQRREAALAAVQELAEGMSALPFDTEDASAYACIRAALERKGNPIGALDMLIAAQAKARELVLVAASVRGMGATLGSVGAGGCLLPQMLPPRCPGLQRSTPDFSGRQA